MSTALGNATIESTLKAMREYSKEHFGMPNGPDFLQFAQTFSESKEAAMQAVFHCLMVSLCSSEVGDRFKANKDNPDAAISSIIGTSAFQTYVEAVYFGYLLGRRAAEVEALDRIAATDSKT